MFGGGNSTSNNMKGDLQDPWDTTGTDLISKDHSDSITFVDDSNSGVTQSSSAPNESTQRIFGGRYERNADLALQTPDQNEAEPGTTIQPTAAERAIMKHCHRSALFTSLGTGGASVAVLMMLRTRIPAIPPSIYPAAFVTSMLLSRYLTVQECYKRRIAQMQREGTFVSGENLIGYNDGGVSGAPPASADSQRQHIENTLKEHESMIKDYMAKTNNNNQNNDNNNRSAIYPGETNFDELREQNRQKSHQSQRNVNQSQW